MKLSMRKFLFACLFFLFATDAYTPNALSVVLGAPEATLPPASTNKPFPKDAQEIAKMVQKDGAGAMLASWFSNASPVAFVGFAILGFGFSSIYATIAGLGGIFGGRGFGNLATSMSYILLYYDQVQRNLGLLPPEIIEQLDYIDPDLVSTDLWWAAKAKLEINSALAQVKKGARTGETLPSILFYGPAGTGKTAAAISIAKDRDTFDVYKLSGAKIYEPEHISTLKGWLETQTTGKNPRKVILVIDECEPLLKLLASGADSRSPFTNEFLSVMGTPNQSYAFFYTSNRISDLVLKDDDALNRRFNKVIYVGIPDAKLRLKIVKQYMQRYITKNNLQDQVKIDPDFLTSEESFQEFKARTEKIPPDVLREIARDIIEFALFFADKENQTTGDENLDTAVSKAPLNDGDIAIAHEELMFVKLDIREEQKISADEEARESIQKKVDAMEREAKYNDLLAQQTERRLKEYQVKQLELKNAKAEKNQFPWDSGKKESNSDY